MTLTKQHFKLVAEGVAKIEDDEKRTEHMNILFPVFRSSNTLFDGDRFKEYVRRLRTGESLKGLR